MNDWYQQVGDYFWHLALPVTANVIGGFATLTLTSPKLVYGMKSQGQLTWSLPAQRTWKEKQVAFTANVFRNAMLIVDYASLPGGSGVAVFFQPEPC